MSQNDQGQAVRHMSTAYESSEVTDIVLDHEYDGIQEYDNPLPGWWKQIFWVSIYFAVFYALYHHFGMFGGQTIHASYQAQYTDWAYKRYKIQKAFDALPLEQQFKKAMKNEKNLAAGKKIFAGSKAACYSCHGKEGQGTMLGPNLTDNYWVTMGAVKRPEGPRLRDLFRVITKGGRPLKAMPAWEKKLSAMERVQVALFVASLRGKKPKEAMPPEKDAKKFRYIGSKVVP